MAASGPGPPGDGVVRSSALSFLAQAQGLGTGESNSQEAEQAATQADRLVPAGLKALCDSCSELYPDQPNPLQVTTRLKYWLGGEDPLDYISMYWHPGIPEEQVPPHWHYISFGLSDLHGDGRVHPVPGTDRSQPSGYGLELTFRLALPAAGAPPLWPAALLQALARYIFSTGNKFVSGDHVSWHAPLDASASRVRHLLVADDARLRPTDTPYGRVNFLQLVGCTGRELRAAQRSSGFEVLKLLQEDPSCGGSWLVTHVSRRTSARRVRVARQIRSPAHLAGVSARVTALPWTPSKEEESGSMSPRAEQQIKDTLKRGLSSMSDRPTEVSGHMSTDSFEMSSIEKALPEIPELMQGSWRGEDRVEYLEGVHLIMDPEAASLLPLAIDGRVLHGRHFTWRSGARAATVLSARVAGAAVTPQRPYGCKGDWLQILLSPELAKLVSASVAPLSRLTDDSESDEDDTPPAPSLPLTLAWPEHGLKISVLYDQQLL
ncbi:suppressor of fused homolog [Cydia fagiglandana]|uniref:suppressor of fused homolog n=1 Tax=Cydia fagiglandana TaxID=1458189 RepID=UPI002FEE4ED8